MRKKKTAMEGTNTMGVPGELPVLRERGAVLERVLADGSSGDGEHAPSNPPERREGHVEKRTAELSKEKEHLKSLLEMHERDRRLIGFEIHDGLAQLLSGVMMHLGNFRRMADQGDPGAWDSFDVATGLVAQGLQEARRLIHDLRPSELEEGGLVSAIEDLISDARDQWGLDIEFVHRVQAERLPGPLEHTVYRVVQEALTNACRHSKSRRIRVLLCQQDSSLQICVEDWGTGFDPDSVAEGHYGLEGIRERARIFGGEVTVTSKLGWGTRVSVMLPLLSTVLSPPVLHQ
jgi:signal transduction histidine kinase